MRGDFPVVLDACVLIPMPLVDTLLRLAAEPRLYLPKWTDQIMAEVSRNLIEKFQLSEDKAAYRESEIRRHFPEAWVSGFEQLIPVMTNHEKDRHVLAAAVRAQAEIIVTYNRGDFPTASLAPYSISVQGPSTFVSSVQPMLRTSISFLLQPRTLTASTTATATGLFAQIPPSTKVI